MGCDMSIFRGFCPEDRDKHQKMAIAITQVFSRPVFRGLDLSEEAYSPYIIRVSHLIGLERDSLLFQSILACVISETGGLAIHPMGCFDSNRQGVFH